MTNSPPPLCVCRVCAIQGVGFSFPEYVFRIHMSLKGRILFFKSRWAQNQFLINWFRAPPAGSLASIDSSKQNLKSIYSWKSQCSCLQHFLVWILTFSFFRYSLTDLYLWIKAVTLNVFCLDLSLLGKYCILFKCVGCLQTSSVLCKRKEYNAIIFWNGEYKRILIAKHLWTTDNAKSTLVTIKRCHLTISWIYIYFWLPVSTSNSSPLLTLNVHFLIFCPNRSFNELSFYIWLYFILMRQTFLRMSCFELTEILLPQSSDCWDYSHVTLYRAYNF